MRVALIVGFAVIVISSFIPQFRLWGVNHLAFIPIPVRLVLFAAIGVTFWPRAGKAVYTSVLRVAHRLGRGGRAVAVTVAVVSLLAIGLFAWQWSATMLLGDGQLIAQSFDAAWEGHETVVMRNARAIVTEELIAPGATLVYYGAARLLDALFDARPVYGIRWVNCVLGGVVLFSLLTLLRRGAFTTETRAWLLVLSLFSVAMQLFFGYVENYTPLVAVLFFYVVLGFRMLHSNRGVWLAITLWVVAFYIHIQAALFLPSLAFLVAWRFAGTRRYRVERVLAPALAVLTVVAAALAGAFTRLRGFYLPFRADEESYGLFSPSHFLDVANEILMLMPVLPMLLVMVWLVRGRGRPIRTPAPQNLGPAGTRKGARGSKGKAGKGRRAAQPEHTPQDWFTTAAEWQYTLLILVPCAVYLLLFKPEIGMARDWDLFAMSVLGLIPLAVLIINRFLRVTQSHERAHKWAAPAMAITAVFGVSWIAINASEALTTQRFMQILEYDKTHASYAYENLSIYYYDKGDLDRAIEVLKIGTDQSKNPRQLTRLAMYYEDNGQREEALALMRAEVEKRPEYDKSRFFLVTLLEKEQAWEELNRVAKQGLQYHPKEPIYWFYFGETSIYLGDVQTGLDAFATCRKLNPPAAAINRMDKLMRQLREQQRRQ